MKYRVVLLLLIPLLLLTSCSSELLPTALAAKTQDAVEEIKQDNDDVFDEIQHNIDLVTKLKAKVQKNQMDGKTTSLNSIINDIEKVAESYSRLASQKDDIRKGILQKVAKVEKMRDSVDAEIKILRERKADYTEQLRLVNDQNPEISKTRREALKRAVSYVDQQIRLWQEFNRIERDIVIEMTEIEKTLDSFLAMIQSTSILFNEGLNLLRLQKNLGEAIALFTSDIPRLSQLTFDMGKSWDNLDYLLDSLTGIARLSITQ